MTLGNDFAALVAAVGSVAARLRYWSRPSVTGAHIQARRISGISPEIYATPARQE
jgi:hypothetical protein